MLTHEYERMAVSERTHWWYRALHRRVAHQLAARFATDDEFFVVDAGCGTGGTCEAVCDRFPRARYAGCDPSDAATGYFQARTGRPVARGSADALPFATDSADAILCLDVLYYASVSMDDAVDEFRRVLRPGGTLIINLPAFGVLRGRHDAAVGIDRRFRASDLKGPLEGRGFRIVDMSYWNAPLFLPLLIWRNLSRWHDPDSAVSDLKYQPAGWLNESLDRLMRLEGSLPRRLRPPFGSSLFCAATL